MKKEGETNFQKQGTRNKNKQRSQWLSTCSNYHMVVKGETAIGVYIKQMPGYCKKGSHSIKNVMQRSDQGLYWRKEEQMMLVWVGVLERNRRDKLATAKCGRHDPQPT